MGDLCDWKWFAQAADPVEWEVFRTAVLTSQGWQLRRIWAPGYLRDPESLIRAIREQTENIVESSRPAAPRHEL